jgi:predicted nucleic acid-binding protein
MGNALLVAHRRKRITFDQLSGFLGRLSALPIDVAALEYGELWELPPLAQKYALTNYDAAYLALALKLRLPLASNDVALRQAAASAGVEMVS